MKMPKPTEESKAAFRDLIEPLAGQEPNVQVKPMFGNLGGFVNGNMFAGLFGDEIGVKLDAADAAELADAGGGPFGPEERPMGGYLTVPPDADAAAWAGRALAYVATLPPKVRKPPPRKK